MDPFQGRKNRVGERLGFLLVLGDPVAARVKGAARIFAAEHRHGVDLGAGVAQNLERRKLAPEQSRGRVGHHSGIDGPLLHGGHRGGVEPDADDCNGVRGNAVLGKQEFQEEVGG